MTAAEAVIRAQAAGLVLTVVPDGLNVRGPKAVRAELVPVLRPLTEEILALLARSSPCVPGPGACPVCGYTHGTREPRLPCTGCGRSDWIVTVVMNDGDRVCPGCLRGAFHAA